jgi:CheY-like chemotaxis protein
VNTAAKSRRSSVLLSASSSKHRGQQQQYGGGAAGFSSSSDGGGVLGDRTLAGVLGLAGFNPGGLCQDSDETCSVVSSDAGTVASGETPCCFVLFCVVFCTVWHAAGLASSNSSNVWDMYLLARTLLICAALSAATQAPWRQARPFLTSFALSNLCGMLYVLCLPLLWDQGLASSSSSSSSSGWDTRMHAHLLTHSIQFVSAILCLLVTERETISLLSMPAGHKSHRSAAAAAAAAAAALTPQGSANLAAAAAAAEAGTPLAAAAAAAAAAAGGFAGLSSSPAVHSPSPLTNSLLLQQQQQYGSAAAAAAAGVPYSSSSAAAAAAAPGEAAMPLLRGKRVLLVEPCRVVRSVLALALRSWGCLVCAVASEAAAMQRLVMNGTLHLSPGSAAAVLAEAEAAECAAPTAADSAAAAAAAAGGSSSSSGGILLLEHAPDMDERKFCCSGPYDCVLLDMHHTR